MGRKFIFRNQPDFTWLNDLLDDGHTIERYSSFAFEPKDEFGDISIKFNKDIFEDDNDLIEIEYSGAFFEDHPNLAMYVTANYSAIDNYEDSIEYDSVIEFLEFFGFDKSFDEEELALIGTFENEMSLFKKHFEDFYYDEVYEILEDSWLMSYECEEELVVTSKVNYVEDMIASVTIPKKYKRSKKKEVLKAFDLLNFYQINIIFD